MVSSVPDEPACRERHRRHGEPAHEETSRAPQGTQRLVPSRHVDDVERLVVELRWQLVDVARVERFVGSYGWVSEGGSGHRRRKGERPAKGISLREEARQNGSRPCRRPGAGAS